MDRAQRRWRRSTRVFNRLVGRCSEDHGRENPQSTTTASTTLPCTRAISVSGCNLFRKEKPATTESLTHNQRPSLAITEPTSQLTKRIQEPSRTKLQSGSPIDGGRPSNSNSSTSSILPADTSPTSGSSTGPSTPASLCLALESGLTLDLAAPSTTLIHSKKRTKDPSPEPQSTQIIRERQQNLLDEEVRLNQKLIDEYRKTGDARVFASFLAPFISEDGNGKRRKLGDWKWDREVERHFREDKAAGTKIWAPVEASFV
ncbi:hypothetical protein QBC40DRAFT_278814 [Triangularia verruculosa]|uniref:Uncharacterized protein n=1 Tax=Triangularia verruculosa TaxID=2587418 RepID=A0AAN7AXP1_9PEZI|nr:hypothetical protein QBC40DRAFT_278814 [Triangularia verruculosa]